MIPDLRAPLAVSKRDQSIWEGEAEIGKGLQQNVTLWNTDPGIESNENATSSISAKNRKPKFTNLGRHEPDLKLDTKCVEDDVTDFHELRRFHF